MQRKAYLPGVAALLAALLAGCTGGSGSGEAADDSKAGDSGTSAPPAEPGKYRTLPEPCSQVDHDTLDTLLPGIGGITDQKQQDKAYAGTATLTFDTDRRVGCRWTMDSPAATHHLLVDFERVVSYDGTVSDDTRAEQVFAAKEADADLPVTPDPENSASATAGSEDDSDGNGDGSDTDTDGKNAGSAGKNDKGDKGSKSGGGESDTGDAGSEDSGDDAGNNGSAEGNDPPEDLRSRLLDDLGDAAYLDDVYVTAASASRHRTVTVVFRTSNVIVTVGYDEQPTGSAEVPDSRKMQDTAQELAHQLAGKFTD